MPDMIYTAARVLLGGLFFYSGLNGFFNFKPLPPMNERMTEFSNHLMGTKIIMPVVKFFEVLCGLLLILNVFPFLATLMLLPICFFIVVAHLKFNRPQGFGISAFISFCVLMIFIYHQDSLVGLLSLG